uniref:Integrase catalytic domain-containing protein n=1 Tax=Eptatretus burgeri TaxID=7764 RepID=A0A8C4QBL7_EPTBU
MSRDIKRYYASCPICQRLGKGVKVFKAPLKPLPVISQPFQFVAADFVGPLPKTSSGKHYLLTVMRQATKYAEAYSLEQADSTHAIESLKDMFSRHGLPTKFLTDRGSVFLSEVFEGFLSELGVQHLTTSPYRPECNGTCEWFIGTFKTMIKAVTDQVGGQWDQVIPWLLFAHWSAPHRSTGYTPFFMLYGREPRGPLHLLFEHWVESPPSTERSIPDHIHETCSRIHDALKAASISLTDQAVERKLNYDKKAKAVSFTAGDPVLVHLLHAGRPMVTSYQGPYLIREKVGSHTYVVDMPDKRIKKNGSPMSTRKPCQPTGSKGP